MFLLFGFSSDVSHQQVTKAPGNIRYVFDEGISNKTASVLSSSNGQIIYGKVINGLDNRSQLNNLPNESNVMRLHQKVYSKEMFVEKPSSVQSTVLPACQETDVKTITQSLSTPVTIEHLLHQPDEKVVTLQPNKPDCLKRHIVPVKAPSLFPGFSELTTAWKKNKPSPSGGILTQIPKSRDVNDDVVIKNGVVTTTDWKAGRKAIAKYIPSHLRRSVSAVDIRDEMNEDTVDITKPSRSTSCWIIEKDKTKRRSSTNKGIVEEVTDVFKKGQSHRPDRPDVIAFMNQKSLERKREQYLKKAALAHKEREKKLKLHNLDLFARKRKPFVPVPQGKTTIVMAPVKHASQELHYNTCGNQSNPREIVIKQTDNVTNILPLPQGSTSSPSKSSQIVTSKDFQVLNSDSVGSAGDPNLRNGEVKLPQRRLSENNERENWDKSTNTGSSVLKVAGVSHFSNGLGITLHLRNQDSNNRERSIQELPSIPDNYSFNNVLKRKAFKLKKSDDQSENTFQKSTGNQIPISRHNQDGNNGTIAALVGSTHPVQPIMGKCDSLENSLSIVNSYSSFESNSLTDSKSKVSDDQERSTQHNKPSDQRFINSTASDSSLQASSQKTEIDAVVEKQTLEHASHYSEQHSDNEYLSEQDFYSLKEVSEILEEENNLFDENGSHSSVKEIAEDQSKRDGSVLEDQDATSSIQNVQDPIVTEDKSISEVQGEFADDLVNSQENLSSLEEMIEYESEQHSVSKYSMEVKSSSFSHAQGSVENSKSSKASIANYDQTSNSLGNDFSEILAAKRSSFGALFTDLQPSSSKSNSNMDKINVLNELKTSPASAESNRIEGGMYFLQHESSSNLNPHILAQGSLLGQEMSNNLHYLENLHRLDGIQNRWTHLTNRSAANAVHPVQESEQQLQGAFPSLERLERSCFDQILLYHESLSRRHQEVISRAVADAMGDLAAAISAPPPPIPSHLVEDDTHSRSSKGNTTITTPSSKTDVYTSFTSTVTQTGERGSGDGSAFSTQLQISANIITPEVHTPVRPSSGSISTEIQSRHSSISQAFTSVPTDIESLHSENSDGGSSISTNIESQQSLISQVPISIPTEVESHPNVSSVVLPNHVSNTEDVHSSVLTRIESDIKSDASEISSAELTNIETEVSGKGHSFSSPGGQSDSSTEVEEQLSHSPQRSLSDTVVEEDFHNDGDSSNDSQISKAENESVLSRSSTPSKVSSSPPVLPPPVTRVKRRMKATQTSSSRAKRTLVDSSSPIAASDQSSSSDVEGRVVALKYQLRRLKAETSRLTRESQRLELRNKEVALQKQVQKYSKCIEQLNRQLIEQQNVQLELNMSVSTSPSFVTEVVKPKIHHRRTTDTKEAAKSRLSKKSLELKVHSRSNKYPRKSDDDIPSDGSFGTSISEEQVTPYVTSFEKDSSVPTEMDAVDDVTHSSSKNESSLDEGHEDEGSGGYTSAREQSSNISDEENEPTLSASLIYSVSNENSQMNESETVSIIDEQLSVKSSNPESENMSDIIGNAGDISEDKGVSTEDEHQEDRIHSTVDENESGIDDVDAESVHSQPEVNLQESAKGEDGVESDEIQAETIPNKTGVNLLIESEPGLSDGDLRVVEADKIVDIGTNEEYPKELSHHSNTLLNPFLANYKNEPNEIIHRDNELNLEKGSVHSGSGSVEIEDNKLDIDVASDRSANSSSDKEQFASVKSEESRASLEPHSDESHPSSSMEEVQSDFEEEEQSGSSREASGVLVLSEKESDAEKNEDVEEQFGHKELMEETQDNDSHVSIEDLHDNAGDGDSFHQMKTSKRGKYTDKLPIQGKVFSESHKDILEVEMQMSVASEIAFPCSESKSSQHFSDHGNLSNEHSKLSAGDIDRSEPKTYIAEPALEAENKDADVHDNSDEQLLMDENVLQEKVGRSISEHEGVISQEKKKNLGNDLKPATTEHSESLSDVESIQSEIASVSSQENENLSIPVRVIKDPLDRIPDKNTLGHQVARYIMEREIDFCVKLVKGKRRSSLDVDLSHRETSLHPDRTALRMDAISNSVLSYLLLDTVKSVGPLSSRGANVSFSKVSQRVNNILSCLQKEQNTSISPSKHRPQDLMVLSPGLDDFDWGMQDQTSLEQASEPEWCEDDLGLPTIPMQVSGPFYYRAIPDKPPPPYTPPVGPMLERLVKLGRIPPLWNLPQDKVQVGVLLETAARLLYPSFCEDLAKVASMEASSDFLSPVTKIDTATTLNECAYKRFIFDLAKEVTFQYHSTKKTLESWKRPRKLCTPIPVVPNDSGDFSLQVQSLARTALDAGTGLDKALKPILRHRSKKHDLVDKLLLLEMAREEGDWVDYQDDEVTVKCVLADAVFSYLVEETVDVLSSPLCLRQQRKSLATSGFTSAL